MERCPYCFKIVPEGGECTCHYEQSKNAEIEEALRPGTIVGACYQIGAVLGQGGFGITYRGYDLDMQKIVAIKEFFPKGLVMRVGTISGVPASEGRSNAVRPVNTEGKEVFRKSLDLFYREAVALGRLEKQPNVVHAHHIFRENGTAYIVMEFVEGRSLKSVIEERGRIPEDELHSLLSPVLTALDRVHQEGILHRDIAPDNIMIENGQPVLVDFGAARVEEGNHSSLVIGKKGYSSYEQMAGAQQDARSDIYSMGAACYTALSGIVPQDAAMRGIRDQVIPLKDLVPGISEKTSDAVAKAMELDPDKRWNSAAEFRDALCSDPDRERKESTYQAARILMKNGTAEGYAGAGHLFQQISGYKDADDLASQCREKAEAVPDRKKTGADESGREKLGDTKKILAAVIIAAAAGFFLLQFLFRSRSDVPAVQTEMVQTQSSLSAAQPEQTISSDKDAYPAVSETPVPTDTNTPIPTDTNTPVPTDTNTPVPTDTNTPVPTDTSTPVPTDTSTPVPTDTNTPIPTDTNTPVPTDTNTPIPTDTNTPVPTDTSTPMPTTAPGFDIDPTNGVLIKYMGNADSVTIPDGIVSIGEGAFKNCRNLTSVTIPESVTAIGEQAFKDCSNLVSVNIPDGVTAISDSTFSGCSSLTSIMIPDSVTMIGNWAFSGCTVLRSLVIPDSVTVIGRNAFEGCSSLKKINIPENVTVIADWTFYDCSSLISITIPDGASAVGDWAFYNCSSLKSVVISGSAASVGAGSFSGCSSLVSVTIPDGVTSIGRKAFEGCSSLTTAMIADSVTYIGESAFRDCSNLASVTIPESVTYIGPDAFSPSTTIRMQSDSYAEQWCQRNRNDCITGNSGSSGVSQSNKRK